jgi:hypothetical protein
MMRSSAATVRRVLPFFLSQIGGGRMLPRLRVSSQSWSAAVRAESAGLFDGAVKRRELGIDPGFDSDDGGENSKRDACGDQTVFNGRCGSLVRNEPETTFTSGR